MSSIFIIHEIGWGVSWRVAFWCPFLLFLEDSTFHLYFWGGGRSKITADGDCSHEIKRCLLLGRKAMSNLDSILKSRDITLLTKVCLVKAMVFPVVMYGYECWTIRKAEHGRIDAFELWCWRRLLRALDCKKIQPINPKGNHCWIFIRRTGAKVLNIRWKDWSNTLTTWCEELTHLKRPWCWERLKAGGERDNRGWDGWMASPIWWTWVWVNSKSWWWTGKPGVLRSMRSQRVRHERAAELNWTISHLKLNLSGIKFTTEVVWWTSCELNSSRSHPRIISFHLRCIRFSLQQSKTAVGAQVTEWPVLMCNVLRLGVI